MFKRCLAVGLTCVMGCSPALDFREFVPEGSGIAVRFPCRPDRQSRAVTLAGNSTRMDMLSCNAEGMTFALAYADIVDPAAVGAALAALRAAATDNIGAVRSQRQAYAIEGITPHDETARLSIDGRLPSGATVHEHAAFFARGLRVYQASVIGAAPDPDAVEIFLSGHKFPK